MLKPVRVAIGAVFAAIGAATAGYLMVGQIDWRFAALGAVTGIATTLWDTWSEKFWRASDK